MDISGIRAGWRSWVGALILVVVTWGSAPAARAPVDTAQLQSLLKEERPAVFLLDVRTPGEWSEGHIGGSVLIPMNQVPGRLAEIPRDKKILVVCATGARSAAVARFLDQKGYPWVANYEGGVFEWHRRGLSLER